MGPIISFRTAFPSLLRESGSLPGFTSWGLSILASLSPEYFPREGIRSVLSTPQFPVTDTNQQKSFRLIESPTEIIVHRFGAEDGYCKMAAIRHQLNDVVQR